MKSNMKKFLALLLSLSLVLATFGDFAQVKAADSYTEVTLTGTSGWSTSVSADGTTWTLYLTTEGYNYSNDNWDRKYEPFTIVVNGLEGTTGQVSCTGTTDLYCTIPTSLVPATDGTTFTIKAGQYEPELGTTTGLNILNDLQIVVSEGHLVHTTVYDVGTAEAFVNDGEDASKAFYFNLKDKNGNEVLTGYESWSNWLSPAWCDGTRITQDAVPDQWSTVYSGVFIDGQPMDYWGAHFKNTDACGRFYIDGLSAVVGTKITIRGMFASSTTSWDLNGSYFLEEFSFTFDGTNWIFSSPTEYTGVTLLDNKEITETTTYVDGTDWILDVPTKNYTSSDTSYEYKDIKILCNGVEGTATQVTSLADNKLRFRIPTSLVPNEEGITFTILGGKYEPGNTSTIDGINILQDYDVAVVRGHLTHTQVIEAENVSTFNNTGDIPTEQFYFSLTDANGTAISTGTETDWLHFLNPAWSNGTRIDDGSEGLWTSNYGGVFVDTGDGNKPLNYWEYRFSNVGAGVFNIYLKDAFTVTNGTVVTVRGFFVSALRTEWGDSNGEFYLHEMKFIYEDADETDDVYGAWRYVEGPIYKQYEGTPVYESSEAAGFYFTAGETKFPYDAQSWTVVATPEDENSGIFLSQDDGATYQKLSVNLQKVGEDRWYAWMAGDTSVTLGRNDIVLLKGSFIYNDEHRITFADTKFMYNGTGYGPYVEVVDHGTVTPEFESSEKVGFYFTAEESVTPVFPYDEATWSVRAAGADDESGVFLSDDGGDTLTKMDVSLQKVGEKRWYAYIAGDTTNIPKKDDMIIIAGTFVYENHEIYIEELPVFYTGQYYTTQDPADAPEMGTPTDVTISGIDYCGDVGTPANDYTKYNEAEGCWEITFKTESTELPSCYWNITYTVGETSYTADLINQGKKYGEYVDLLLKIPNTVLPQNLEEKCVITLKATEAVQGRDTTSHALQNSAIKLTEYSFIVGDSYDAVAPVVYYASEASSGNGGDDSCIWLSSNDDFPYISTDWRFHIQEADAESGIFVYDESTETYNRKDVYMIQHADGGYYIKDFGPVANGTTIMLKGTFTQSNLHFITFKTAKYTFKDGKWVVASAIKEVEGTGVDGDATHNSELNSVDLVRMLKFVDEKTEDISLSDADLNNTGDIDTYDIDLERKLLLGLKFYKGAPVYADDAEMRLAAYVAPTTEAGYKAYADAYLNTVIGESIIAVDGDEAVNFDTYMTWAQNNKLKVLVHSGNIVNMTDGTASYSQDLIDKAYEVATADEWQDTFIGFCLHDEPTHSMLDAQQKIVDRLNYLSADKKIELFTSNHPIYATETDPNYLWIDSTDTMTDEERYENYAKAYGTMLGDFTYDFYPFRHEDSGILWWAVDEDYMRSQWFTNLDMAAATSRESRGAFDTGITVQSYAEPAGEDYLREPLQADISFQVYSALAYGMKSINYFTFGEHWEEKQATCMYKEEKTTDLYDAVKAVNEEIISMDHILLKYNWLGTVGVEGLDEDGVIANMNPYGTYTSERIVTNSFTSKNSADTTENADAIIGCLKDLNGYDGFMVVNATDPSDSIAENVSVSFNDANAAKVYVAGKEVDSSDYITVNTDGTITFNATLNPGQGIFVIPYIQ